MLVLMPNHSEFGHGAEKAVVFYSSMEKVLVKVYTL